MPYISEYSQRLELEWGRFVNAGTNAIFMLQELPGKKWQINFLQMVQRNIEVSSCSCDAHVRVILFADWQLSLHCAY